MYLHEPRNLHFEKIPPPSPHASDRPREALLCAFERVVHSAGMLPSFLHLLTPPHSVRLSSNRGHIFCEAIPDSPQVALVHEDNTEIFMPLLISVVIYVKSCVLTRL